MYQDQTPYLGPLVGLSSPKSEQDFWLGAKPSISSSPASLFLVNYKNEYLDNSPLSDCSLFDDLEDAVLPEWSDFGPDDLFPELNDSEGLKKTVCAPHPSNGMEKPQIITIKLKRVSHPKVNNKKFKTTATIPKQHVVHYTIPEVGNNSAKSVQSMDIQGSKPIQVDVETGDWMQLYHADMDFAPLYSLESEMTESRLEDYIADDSGSQTLLDIVSQEGHDGILDNLLSYNETSVEECHITSMQPASGWDMGSTGVDYDSSVSESANTIETYSSPSSVKSDNWSEVSTIGGSSPELDCFELPDHALLSPGSSESIYSMGSPMLFSPFGSSPLQANDAFSEYEMESRICEEVPAQQSKTSKNKRGSKLPKEQKYLRKKQQNKEAALRYRQKKKQSEEESQKYLHVEEKENLKLKKQYKEIRQEISLIKKLMRETLLAR